MKNFVLSSKVGKTRVILTILSLLFLIVASVIGNGNAKANIEDPAGEINVTPLPGDDIRGDIVVTPLPGTCSETTDTPYPQCGGTLGLEDRDPTHTYMITRVRDCNGNILRYLPPQDLGNLGQCAAAPTQPPVCLETSDDPYPQCGGTLGLEDRDPALTFMVTRVRDCRGNIVRYDKDQGRNLGQCAVTPTPSCTETRREYPQCGATVGLENFPRTDTILVAEFTNNCTGAKRYQVVSNLGNRGQCFVSAQNPTPTPTPVVIFPTATPTPTPPPVFVPTVTPTPTLVVAQGGVNQSCPDGTTFGGINGSNIICVQQVQNQVQNAVANANAFTGPITVNVPAGSPRIIESTQVVRTVPQEVIVLAGAQPKSILVQSSELPKTGLPVAAWGFTALAPLGFGLRRFGKNLKESTHIAQFIWQQREWDK